MKPYEFNGRSYDLSLGFDEYNDGSLAAILVDEDGEDFGFATVNLGIPMPERHAFVDTNNLPGIGEWLEENGMAVPTGGFTRSGHFDYPIYRFNA